MPPERTSEILKLFNDGIKEPWPDMDLPSVLEEYLTEAGVRQLDENAYDGKQYINFPEVTVILQHSAAIYCRRVDFLYRMVTNAVTKNDETPTTCAIQNRTVVEKTPRKQRRPVELSDFKPINIEESVDINMRENAVTKPLAFLPKTFMQFESRTISDNDIQLTDYTNEPFGLMRDFRVNWNVDENYALCDNVDFCTSKRTVSSFINNMIHPTMVSPSDSGHNSDFALENISSPRLDEPGLTSCACETIATSVVDNKVIKKRKVMLESPLVKENKYNMSSPLTGSLKEYTTVSVADFLLPYWFTRRIHVIKKKERVILEITRDDIYSCTNNNKSIYINKLSASLKIAKSILMTRENAPGEIIVSANFIGFSNEDEKKSVNSFEGCKLLLGNEDIENDNQFEYNIIDDDDVPDNCYLGNSQDNTLETNIALRRKRDEEANTVNTPPNEISKRVEEWHLSISDKLKAAKSRGKFDLPRYRKDIFDAFASNSVVNFKSIIENKPQEEISRYFLATLFLASKSKIVVEGSEEPASGNFKMSIQPSNFVEEE